MALATVLAVMVNAGNQTENIDQGRADPDTDQIHDDSKMSAENFDDAVAALTLAVTVAVITLAFVFNL